MPTTTYWAPNQSYIAQVETYTYSAPNSIGNFYTATINGKTVTYASVAGDTATTVATAHFNLLSAAPTSGGVTELQEITFTNPSAGVVVATASVPGTPFANLAGGSAPGLVMSTGNGLANGIATSHTTANASPSDVKDPQNWLRVTAPAPGVRAIPVNGDNVVVSGTSTPMLWNLDQLIAVQFNTFTRWQSMTGNIGLLTLNANGYTEWRATYFAFVGPQGSVPAGGLQMVLGYNSGSGTGPSLERYNVGSQLTTLICLAAGNPIDEYGIRFLGVHTGNTFTALGGVSLAIAMQPGEISNLSSCTLDGGATVGIGAGVVWTAASTLTTLGGAAVLNSAPATITASGGTALTFSTDLLTWATVTVQGACTMTWLCGGTITTLTMSVGCSLDKSGDVRALTITNHTIDGDSCYINDPLNAITFTNAGSVKQSVTQGPYRFTGTRTMKLV